MLCEILAKERVVLLKFFSLHLLVVVCFNVGYMFNTIGVVVNNNTLNLHVILFFTVLKCIGLA